MAGEKKVDGIAYNNLGANSIHNFFPPVQVFLLPLAPKETGFESIAARLSLFYNLPWEMASLVFASESCIILKVHFSPTNNMMATLPCGNSIVGIRIAHDWLLLITRKFSDGPMDLFHTPSCTIVQVHDPT